MQKEEKEMKCPKCKFTMNVNKKAVLEQMKKDFEALKKEKELQP